MSLQILLVNPAFKEGKYKLGKSKVKLCIIRRGEYKLGKPKLEFFSLGEMREEALSSKSSYITSREILV